MEIIRLAPRVVDLLAALYTEHRVPMDATDDQVRAAVRALGYGPSMANDVALSHSARRYEHLTGKVF